MHALQSAAYAKEKWEYGGSLPLLAVDRLAIGLYGSATEKVHPDKKS